MKVAVTGGNGFIGGWVCDELAERGHVPVVFDRRHPPGARWEVMLGDVRDATAVTEMAAHVDAVIHLAAVLGTQETIANPRPAAEVNILGGLNVLDACRQYRLPMVNIAVGNHWMRNTYSTTKHAVERLVEQFRDDCGAPVANVRAVNAYGPRQAAPAPFGPSKVRKIVPSFVCRALSGLPIEVYGDGSQVSDMVHVDDVARVLVATVETIADGTIPGRVIEVGPVGHTRVADVAETVRRVCADLSGYPPVPVVQIPMRPGEQPGRDVTADASTLTDVGINPASLVDLTDGLTETAVWFDATEGDWWQQPSPV